MIILIPQGLGGRINVGVSGMSESPSSATGGESTANSALNFDETKGIYTCLSPRRRSGSFLDWAENSVGLRSGLSKVRVRDANYAAE